MLLLQLLLLLLLLLLHDLGLLAVAAHCREQRQATTTRPSKSPITGEAVEHEMAARSEDLLGHGPLSYCHGRMAQIV